ncbi:flagellar hook capping protein [Cryobacterium sp. Hh11]|uniref:flagellar hook assembly protein FlgD n=1 Tax=Cryobacterium sp. Hh11 TaxID=2555868 RepID=UPI00106C8E90|nr:flagellar hook capping FlgD N-terminal domain-containing protein [Cryobacterium sp. Hh11]TFD51413.1 flagellar hook capping protein [Cryobacterium sp. Hh11]
MTITSIVGNSAYTPIDLTTETTRTPSQSMDSEVFMSLLVTQLQNQDPSSPMDTNEMLAQTTQLAMMEKITEMTATNQENFSLQMRIAAAALIGQQVAYTASDGTEMTGTATAVSYAGPVPQVTVGDKSVALDTISGVTSAPATDAA